MKLYQKVAWLQYNDANFSLRNVFGKEKLKYLLQGSEGFAKDGYSYGIEPLTHHNLDQFYVLYAKYINQKHNAHVYDLLSLYAERIDRGESIYLGYLRQGNTLLGGGIFIDKKTHGKRGLMLGFRAFENHIFAKLSIGYYIEYLFFSFGLSLGVEVFSRGSDRNFYGLLGSAVGLPVHKVQLGFMPHILSKDKTQIEIDVNQITQETIAFSQSDLDLDVLDLVNIWTTLSPEEAQKKYAVFAKRGLKINYTYL